MAWDPQNPPTSADDIDAALLDRPAETAQEAWLERYTVLRAAGIEVPLKTRITLVALGHGPDLLKAGDDLCSFSNKAENRGFSVLNPPHDLREEGRKLPSEIVCSLLEEHPDQIRAAVEVKCTYNRDADKAAHVYISGQPAAFAWVHDLKVLRALRDYGVDFARLRNSYGGNVLRACCYKGHGVTDPAIVRFICDGIQPRRDLHAFVEQRGRGATGTNAAEYAFFAVGAPLEVREAVIEVTGAVQGGIRWEDERVQRSELLQRDGPRVFLFKRLLDGAEAQRKGAELMEQEQIIVRTQGENIFWPLELVECCEALKAELERWQPGCGSGGGSNGGRQQRSAGGRGGGGRGRGRGRGGKGPASKQAAPALAGGLIARSVTADDAAPAVLRGFRKALTAPRGERCLVLDKLDVETLLGISVFADKYLYVRREALAAACGQAVRDAIAPQQLGERMLEGAQRKAAGDPTGELLLDHLVPLAVERFDSAGRSQWLGSLPLDVITRITSGAAEDLAGRKKRARETEPSDASATAKKARRLVSALDSDSESDPDM